MNDEESVLLSNNGWKCSNTESIWYKEEYRIFKYTDEQVGYVQLYSFGDIVPYSGINFFSVEEALVYYEMVSDEK